MRRWSWVSRLLLDYFVGDVVRQQGLRWEMGGLRYERLSSICGLIAVIWSIVRDIFFYFQCQHHRFRYVRFRTLTFLSGNFVVSLSNMRLEESFTEEHRDEQGWQLSWFIYRPEFRIVGVCKNVHSNLTPFGQVCQIWKN